MNFAIEIRSVPFGRNFRAFDCASKNYCILSIYKYVIYASKFCNRTEVRSVWLDRNFTVFDCASKGPVNPDRNYENRRTPRVARTRVCHVHVCVCVYMHVATLCSPVATSARKKAIEDA